MFPINMKHIYLVGCWLDIESYIFNLVVKFENKMCNVTDGVQNSRAAPS